MTKKTSRALKRTLLWGLAFSIPLVILLYYKVQYAPLQQLQIYGEVKPFFFERPKREGLSNHHLRQSTNLFALLPSSVNSLRPQDKTRLQEIAAWANDKLSRKDKAKTAFQLYLLGQVDDLTGLQQWQVVEVAKDEDLAAFLPDSYPLTEALLVLVDQNTEIRGIYPLSEVSVDQLTTNWSKMSFNHYLNDYLSKRTFFGPKRS